MDSGSLAILCMITLILGYFLGRLDQIFLSKIKRRRG